MRKAMADTRDPGDFGMAQLGRDVADIVGFALLEGERGERVGVSCLDERANLREGGWLKAHLRLLPSPTKWGRHLFGSGQTTLADNPLASGLQVVEIPRQVAFVTAHGTTTLGAKRNAEELEAIWNLTQSTQVDDG